jgi:hypothetical protein
VNQEENTMQSMRHHALQSIAVAALFSMIVGAQAQAPAPAGADHSMQAQEIAQLIRDFINGQKLDPTLFDEFYAADATFIGYTGRVLDKKEILTLIDMYRRGSTTMACCYTAVDFKVRLFGQETAVVTFGVVEHSVAEFQSKDDVIKDYYRLTGTFRLSNGKWQAVALQATRVQEEPVHDKAKLSN